ncbi:MAG: thiamine-phosphate kinase [Porticoccaceae bacterium]
MPLNEFALIRQYFTGLGRSEDGGDGVALGVGDDCALLDVPEGQQLAVTVDTLVAGVHFPRDAAPEDIARRSLRVNLSDLAAMGAQPRWFTLALTMPNADASWLEAFAAALADDACQFGCALVGGDTTAGPMTISVQMMGLVPRGQALTRAGAKEGDRVYVTGTLGEGAAALQLFEPNPSLPESVKHELLGRFYRPAPRLREGVILCGLASAAIDISDGLLADLGHIAECSGLGAEVELSRLPLAPWLAELATSRQIQEWALSGGDDYELCFTVPEILCVEVDRLIASGDLMATRIGRMTRGNGVSCVDAAGQSVSVVGTGYQHFQ